jgi:hypothetical protein
VRGRGLAVACPAAALALASGVFLLKTRQITGSIGLEAFPLDDTWIHLQFARNLAEGRGFSYNPGVSVSGSTAPLWTVVLGGAFAVAGSHPVLARALGFTATLGAAWLAGRLTSIWTGHGGLGALTSALDALAAHMVWGALSGMEVGLAALLVTASLVGHAQGRVWLAGAALGLAVLARPEAAVLLPLMWLGGPLTWRRAIAWGLPLVACLAPWVAFNLATTGTPLPATAAAKIEGGLLGFLAGTREPLTTTVFGRPWQFAREWGRWLWDVDGLLPILAPVGLWWLGRHRGRAALAPAAILLLHPLAVALLAPYRGPGFQEGRYAIHLLPLAVVVTVTALTPLFTLSPRRGEGRVRGWIREHLGPPAGAALLAGALVALPSAASRYGWAVQNIEAMQVHLGHWVARHTPPTARIGLNDVGAIAYISRREVVDVMGLVTPAIIPFRRDGEMGVLRYLERVCPDYLIIFPAWFPTLTGMSERFRPVYQVRLEHNEVAGADELVVYETVWSRWRPDRQPCPGAVAGGFGKNRESYNRDEAFMKGFRPVLPVALALGTLLPGTIPGASAQIYRWTDDRGDVRYSQGIHSVPPQFRGGAVMMSAPSQPTGPAPAGPEPGAAASATSGVARIPFTPGQPIMVLARINGGGTAQLILDTGAQGTVISPTTLAALGVSYRNAVRGSIKGVTGDADVLAVRVDSVEVEGARFGPLLVVSHDAGLGSGRDGLLGRDFLDNFIVTIDSNARVVTLTPKK